MSYLSRTRKARLREFNKRMGGCPDYAIKSWKCIAIHDVTWKDGEEFDFWCANKKDMYLLRLIKSDKVRLEIIQPKDRNHMMYLIAYVDFDTFNLSVLERTINAFELYGIPTYKYSKIRKL